MRNDRPIVIITGSSGLIGSRLIEHAPDDFCLVGFDNHGPPVPPIRAECVPVDLTSDAGVSRGVERVRYAYGDRVASVIHLAAYYDFAGEDSPLYEDLTVGGTRRLLQGFREHGLTVEQFVYASTMLVHAPCEPGSPISEDSPLEARWAYPKSKIRAEEVVRDARGTTPSVLLRIAGVYTDSCESLPLANQIQRIYERRLTSHVFPGDGQRGQSFVHLDDVAASIWLAVEKRNRISDVTPLLIGEPETLSYDELQRTLGKLIHNEEWQTTRIPKAIARTGAWVQDTIPGIEEPFIKPWMIDLSDDHYEVNIDRARKVLGWMPKHSLRDTLPNMIRFLKSDPHGFYTRNSLEGTPPAEAPREISARMS